MPKRKNKEIAYIDTSIITNYLRNINSRRNLRRKDYIEFRKAIRRLRKLRGI